MSSSKVTTSNRDFDQNEENVVMIIAQGVV